MGPLDHVEQDSFTTKYIIYERATGKRLLRWSPDAREMLTRQPEDYCATAEECDVPAEKAPEFAPPTAAEIPTEHSPGVPLRATRTSDASAAAPLAPPQRSSRKRS